jgi:hypothetical protein
VGTWKCASHQVWFEFAATPGIRGCRAANLNQAQGEEAHAAVSIAQVARRTQREWHFQRLRRAGTLQK